MGRRRLLAWNFDALVDGAFDGNALTHGPLDVDVGVDAPLIFDVNRGVDAPLVSTSTRASTLRSRRHCHARRRQSHSGGPVGVISRQRRGLCEPAGPIQADGRRIVGPHFQRQRPAPARRGGGRSQQERASDPTPTPGGIDSNRVDAGDGGVAAQQQIDHPADPRRIGGNQGEARPVARRHGQQPPPRPARKAVGRSEAARFEGADSIEITCGGGEDAEASERPSVRASERRVGRCLSGQRGRARRRPARAWACPCASALRGTLGRSDARTLGRHPRSDARTLGRHPRSDARTLGRHPRSDARTLGRRHYQAITRTPTGSSSILAGHAWPEMRSVPAVGRVTICVFSVMFTTA